MPNVIPPASEDPTHQLNDVTVRLQLVNRYNYFIGSPDTATAEKQRQFVTGNMTNDDLVGMAKLYRYVLTAVEGTKPD